jgi:hypothetical protein
MNKTAKLISIFIAVILFISFISSGRLFILNIFSGRVHFPGENVGANLKMEDSKIFTVLRRLKVEGQDDLTDEYAVFKVRFKFKGLDIA